MDLIGNNAADLALMADTIGGTLDAMLVDLYQNDFAASRGTVLADLTVATFSGYAQKTVTWLGTSISDDGNPEAMGTMSEWRPNATTITNEIFGLYATAAVGGALLFCARFDDAPLPMATVFDTILCTLRYRPTNGGLVATLS